VDEAAERWRTPVVAGDGSTVLIRAAATADRQAIAAFHANQSRDSNYMRYFSVRRELTDAELDRFSNPDLVSSAVLLAIDGTDLVGIGSWFRRPGRSDAEIAFQVDDRHQGRGLAMVLLEHLAAIAVGAGITRFTAETLRENRAMLSVFTKAGWPIEKRFDSGVVELGWPLATTEGYLDSVERREQLSDSRAMARLLQPASVAIVGASDRPDTVQAAITSSVLRSFEGTIHLVNPNRATAFGRPCVPTIGAVDEPIDLALVVVPPAALDDALESCMTHRVRGAVVYTATDQNISHLIERARDHGLRIIGPASMGIIGTHPDGVMQASLAPGVPRPGRLALSLQSGALGAAILDRTERVGLGISWFVSLGDRADVSGNDLLQFWDDDDATTVIGIYTERFGNPRKFARIARRVARHRPIITVESSDFADAATLYLQAGVIHVPTVVDLIDTARVLVDQPLPRSSVIAVIANASSPLRMTVNAVEGAGLIATSTLLPIAADESAAETAVRRAVNDPATGAVVVIHAPPLATDLDGWAFAIERGAENAEVPVLAVLLGRADGLAVEGGRVPAFSFPEQAVAVLARAWVYAKWREAAATDAPVITERYHQDRVNHTLATVDDALDHDHLIDLLRAAGIDHAATRHVGDAVTGSDDLADEAIAAAADLSYPVAVKFANVRPLGRSALAGIALDLTTADDVRHAVAVIADAVGLGPLHVQEMVPPGLEARVEMTVHPALGPIVGVGLGGTSAAAAGPLQKRVAPITTDEARNMIEAAGLAGVLTANDITTDLLVDLVMRVGVLAADTPRLDRLVLDPIIVSAHRCVVTDASGHAKEYDPVPPLRRL
jgi:acyl-CoA synthetase (NDP forming)/GNAT superfamily N-acetyltransferase